MFLFSYSTSDIVKLKLISIVSKEKIS